MALFSMFFLVSLYLQQVLGYEPLKAGLAYLPLSIVIIVSAGVASQLVTKIGFKPPLVAGAVFTAAGLTWFSQVSPTGELRERCPFPVACSPRSASASVFVSFTIAGVTGTKPSEAGLASGSAQHEPAGGRRPGPRDHRDVANSTTSRPVRRR